MKIDPEIFENGRKLPIVEEFYSIQGEGFHFGKPAYFLRIGGCDVGCSWCDTKFSWDPALHPVIDVDSIITRIAECPAGAVVITGGEPLLFDLDYLCTRLKENETEIFLETSGAHKMTGVFDWICLSPKKQMPPTVEAYEKADELKVIINSKYDLEWAVENSGFVNERCKLYLQPEWSVYKEILPVIVEFVKENPAWNISLQAHKFMRIP